MGNKKQTKRTRKFASQGGVKARLQKGTITNKGSLKRKHGKKNQGVGENEKNIKRTKIESMSSMSQYSEEKQKKRNDADFVGERNLGDLDIDSFFETFDDNNDNNYDDEVVEESRMVDGNEDSADEDDESSDDDDDSDDNNEDALPKSDKDDPRKERKTQHSTSSSDSDGSDDDDIMEAERQMKDEMKKMKKNDPEFHQFLKENEDNLLDFGDDESSNEEQDDNNDDDDRLQRVVGGTDEDVESGSRTHLTVKLLDKLDKNAFHAHGLKALRKVVNAFKSASHFVDDDKETTVKGQAFVIDSSKVFDRLMLLSFTKCHMEFRHHLLNKDSNEDPEDEGIDPNKPINPKYIEKAEKWPTMKPIMLNFFKSTMHILAEAKEPELLTFVLKALSNYIPFLTPFPRLAESMLKTLTTLWSAPVDASEDYQVVRLHSFLRIRQLALTQPFPLIEECLKKSYLAYAQRAKFATSSSASSARQTLTFMGNCVVELYSLDYHSSYQHAFVYIRQLALHLRTAMQKKTTDAVYCWQYMHCLKLWVAVLTEACQSSSDEEGEDGLSSNGEDHLLRSLIFPLTQVILGVARLVPSTRYLPLRLHCVRFLQQIAAAAEIFLPTTSILMDVFDLQELSQPPKKVHDSNVQPISTILRLRADNPLRTMEEMEMCVSETFVLLNREIDLYQYSAGFPEFSVRISQRLKKFSKEARHSRWRAYAKSCLDTCNKYSIWAMNERVNPNNKQISDLSPKDIKQLEILRPHSTPNMGKRHKLSLEKEKRLEVASRPIQRKTATTEKESDNDNHEDDAAQKKGQTKPLGKKKKKKKSRASNDDSAIPSNGGLDKEDIVEDLNWSDDE